jgi:hypothetical protein
MAQHEFDCLSRLVRNADYFNPHHWRKTNVEIDRRMRKADSKIQILTSEFSSFKNQTDRHSTSIENNKQEISKHTQVLKAHGEKIDSYDRK